MSVIATLLSTEAHAQRVRAAVRDRHEIVHCASWADVEEACELRPLRLLIADLVGTTRDGLERVRQLKRRSPYLTVIAYSAITAAHAHELFDAGRAGVDGLVVAEVDDAPRSLLAIIEGAESRGLTTVIRRSLEGVDDVVVDAVLLAVSRAHERLSPAGLARLLVVSRRTLADRLAGAGFPTPQRLVMWGRLIMAAHLLEDPKKSADRVAASLSFPSGSAFRNVCRRYVHATPGEIRRRGGASFVIRSMTRRGTVGDGTRGRGRRPRVAL